MIYVANGLINPAAEAMLVDVSTPESRTFMYAVNYWAINISILIGTLLGGWFYQDHFTALLTGLLGVSFVTLFLAWRFMMETLSRPVTTESRQGISFFALLTNYGQVIKDRKFMLFLAAFVLMMSIEFGRSNAIPVHLAQHFTPLTVAGLQLTGVKAMSLLTAVNTLMVVALTIPVSNWVKRHDLQSVMLWGTALYAGGFVALYGLTDLTVLLIASIVLTMGELLYVPSRQTLLADMIPEDRRGAYLAVSGQVFTVAKWLAVLGIPLSAAIGGIAMMIVVGLLGVGSILLARRSV